MLVYEGAEGKAENEKEDQEEDFFFTLGVPRKRRVRKMKRRRVRRIYTGGRGKDGS